MGEKFSNPISAPTEVPEHLICVWFGICDLWLTLRLGLFPRFSDFSRCLPTSEENLAKIEGKLDPLWGQGEFDACSDPSNWPKNWSQMIKVPNWSLLNELLKKLINNYIWFIRNNRFELKSFKRLEDWILKPSHFVILWRKNVKNNIFVFDIITQIFRILK